jgi:acyl-CoA reductase-like NAD-dependent aldehyde dehydrogenase
MDDAYIVKDPLGVVLIISPWNYPVNLLLLPLVGAIAAGNCVVLKPSEVSEHTQNLVAKLMPKYFEQDYIRVITGGIPETTALLKERFDHIFFTGNPIVGRIVMEAASKHLTPVTLELGGKCPAIIDRNCDIAVAGRRIAWGKFMSCGQTCLAPDHILCPKEVQQELVDSIRATVEEFYTANPKQGRDYSRMISEKQFKRVSPLIQSSGRVVYGGETDETDLFIAPTILLDVKPTDDIMKEEIFGPVLPVLTVESVDEAVDMVKEMEKPLAVYIFSRDQKNIDKVLRETSSGGSCVNDVILHIGLDTLPFGGVGNSGIGRYHGKFTFDTFTHEKSVLQRGLTGEKILWMRYPPYDDKKFYWTKQLSKKRALPEFLFIKYVPLFVIGIIFGYILHTFQKMGEGGW